MKLRRVGEEFQREAIAQELKADAGRQSRLGDETIFGIASLRSDKSDLNFKNIHLTVF